MRTVFQNFELKPKNVYAYQYKGEREEAEHLEKQFYDLWIETDDADSFCGLRGFTQWGYDNNKSQYVDEGDYLVANNGRVMLVPKDEFESTYRLTKFTK